MIFYFFREIGLQNTYYINNTVKVVEYVAEASNDIRFDQNDSYPLHLQATDDLY